MDLPLELAVRMNVVGHLQHSYAVTPQPLRMSRIFSPLPGNANSHSREKSSLFEGSNVFGFADLLFD